MSLTHAVIFIGASLVVVMAAPRGEARVSSLASVHVAPDIAAAGMRVAQAHTINPDDSGGPQYRPDVSGSAPHGNTMMQRHTAPRPHHKYYYRRRVPTMGAAPPSSGKAAKDSIK